MTLFPTDNPYGEPEAQEGAFQSLTDPIHHLDTFARYVASLVIGFNNAQSNTTIPKLVIGKSSHLQKDTYAAYVAFLVIGYKSVPSLLNSLISTWRTSTPKSFLSLLFPSPQQQLNNTPPPLSNIQYHPNTLIKKAFSSLLHPLKAIVFMQIPSHG